MSSPSSDQVPRIPHEAAKTAAYGAGATRILFMQAGMAAHFIELLARLGWAMGAVVAMSTMLASRGAQSPWLCLGALIHLDTNIRRSA